ncbi:efflux RND transporter periplasmic adaptor subunit [Christiangramia sp. SM2212]|uniref:Efflux RND transporter periplasmic adaptor subunit n=1 Tax=Christiangramia sediminicola TaxID=3073267 RepID=A0ABU1ETT0_9FLAO|nr:efflux RND transporter periplasmic adaptor subunit [Christiangramia sp. SM2212]MDR5591563.1 efflux RND transporter periplasmic adaptor subunit [Christiangramia sp. SM2212]
MKKLILLIGLPLILISCGEGKKNSTEAVLESNDTEKIQQKRDELTNQLVELETEIKQLDAKLKEINPERNIPLVTSYAVESEKFDHFLELQGSVETKKNVVLNAEMGGVLERIYVEEGQKVSKGQTLAKIDDGGLSQQLAQMQTQLELAKTTFERQKRLWDQQIGSEMQYLQAKSNYEGQVNAVNQMKSQVAKSVVTAPFSGVIDDIITEQGNVVSPGQTQILRIVNLDDMYIKTDIPESYISNVTKGKTVEVTFPVLGDTVETKIKQTGSYINPNNRTFNAEIEVPNKEKNIKPNLTARVRINDYTNENAILVPQNIISENAEGQQYLYVLDEQEDDHAVAKRVIIETGKSQGDKIEVLNGLKDGDMIIQEGARSVKEGQTVKLINY